jgi:hypothetical protein
MFDYVFPAPVSDGGGNGGSSGLVLIDSDTVTVPVELCDFTLPAGYVELQLVLWNVRLSDTDILAAAFSQDGGTSFINDLDGYDSYLNSSGSSDALILLSSQTISHTAQIAATSRLWISPGNVALFPSLFTIGTSFYNNARLTMNFSCPDPAATITPSPGRATTLRVMPYGSGNANSLTSGHTMTLDWELRGRVILSS